MEFFSIILDNPTATYLPGQFIVGKVIFKSREEETIKGISLKFEGKAEVHWTESQSTHHSTINHMHHGSTINHIHHGSTMNHIHHHSTSNHIHHPNHNRTVSYNSSDLFFHYQAFLIGNGETEMSLPPGESWYPFSIQLPISNLFSSFEGDYGKVEYILKATVKRAFWKLDYKTRQTILVSAVVDLNHIPMAAQPGEWKTFKTFCCLWCASGPLTMRVSMPKRGYIPGERISVEVDVSNQSSRRINDLSAELIQQFTFFAQGKSKCTSHSVICVNRNESVEPYNSALWRFEFEVSLLPPTNLGGCRIINLDYILKAKAHVSGAGLNLKQYCPVFIGSIPILQQIEPGPGGCFENNAMVHTPSAPPLNAFSA